MAKKLWGGRFEKKTNPLVEKFTQSIDYDKKLAKYDILGSLIHIVVLEKSAYLSPPEKSSLKKELFGILHSIRDGSFKLDSASEDIHTNIQNILQEKLGDTALKLHMARSRNDQVVFATKFYCKVGIGDLENFIREFILSLEDLIKKNDIIIPGFTHMQHAQPVYLKDYLIAYISMMKRDSARLSYISKHIKITMGAGALAGTPVAASQYSADLRDVLSEDDSLAALAEHFDIEATENSIDSVSDRDFIIEIINALSILAMHLSRLAEDFIIWSTKEFDFIEIDDSFCTGSSLMPQKKNPDVLELIRGYAGRVYGNLISVLTMMKGLPLTYNRDMQLDKEPLFNSFEIVSMELEVLTGIIKTLEFNKDNIKAKLIEDESLYATDLVYYLVNKEIPFSKAHEIIGKLIRYSVEENVKIKLMKQERLSSFSDKLIKDEIAKLFDPKVSVESKKSIKRK